MTTLTTKETWSQLHDLPSTLLIDVDGESMGLVGTREYVNKAISYFHDFYNGGIEDKREAHKARIKMKTKVIEQAKYILSGKTFDNGLDVIGVWMQRDILFPQDIQAHRRPAKKMDLVELYLHINAKK